MHGTLPAGDAVAPAWFPDWSGDVCAIVAGGESVSRDAVDRLKGRCRVLVINNGYQLAPWADALYACDGRWWAKYPDAGQFAGLKITQDSNAAKTHNLHHVELIEENWKESRITAERKGLIARGGHSGFQAVNIAVQFGATRHLWFGFDFRGDHWHGRHEELMNPRPASLVTWAGILDRQSPILAALGVEVVNCSERSLLTAYRKMTVDEALQHFGV